MHNVPLISTLSTHLGPWKDMRFTSSTGLALLYTERMWVIPFWDRHSLFSESVDKNIQWQSCDQQAHIVFELNPAFVTVM